MNVQTIELINLKWAKIPKDADLTQTEKWNGGPRVNYNGCPAKNLTGRIGTWDDGENYQDGFIVQNITIKSDQPSMNNIGEYCELWATGLGGAVLDPDGDTDMFSLTLKQVTQAAGYLEITGTYWWTDEAPKGMEDAVVPAAGGLRSKWGHTQRPANVALNRYLKVIWGPGPNKPEFSYVRNAEIAYQENI